MWFRGGCRCGVGNSISLLPYGEEDQSRTFYNDFLETEALLAHIKNKIEKNPK